MKDFRKITQSFFICEECGNKFVRKNGLSRHVNLKHNLKSYYDKWLKEEGEGLCKICGKETIFTALKRGYKICCSEKCAKMQTNITSTIKYGIDRFNFEKAQKTGFKLKQFNNTNIWYQGSYELDFLEHFYTQYTDIQRGPIIHYKFNENNKSYHPDFYIPSLHLIVECKNHYLAKCDKEKIKAKEKATIASGFNYIMIVDKDYIKFLSTIK